MTSSMLSLRRSQCCILLLLGMQTWLAACASGEVGPDGGDTEGGCGRFLAGDLVISEVMIDPNGSDTGFEWFEIWNATSAAVRLNGLRVTVSAIDGSRDKSHIFAEATIESGQYFVLGDKPNDESLPEHMDYGYGNELGSFANTAKGGRLILSCGTSIIDDIVYVRGAAEGVSRVFDGALAPDAIANDDLTMWCDAKTPWGQGSFATPQTRNDVCGAPSLCEENGVERVLAAPTLGDLVITEMLPNPTKPIEDKHGEWFEVYVVNDVDLNGLGLGRDIEDFEIEAEVVGRECVHVEAGTYLVWAASDDPEVNGGLPRVDQVLGFSLSNSESGVFLAWGGELVDAVTWSRSLEGASWNLDPERMTPEGNDTLDAFCRATTPYHDTNFGTPGGPNISCDLPLPAGTCADEDGSARDIVVPGPGDVIITEFMPNPAAVGDGQGEWFELRANADVDLNGLELGRDAGVEDVVETRACVHVRAGESAVFTKNADSATNGGLPEAAFEFGFALVNSNGRLFVGYGGEVLDEVAWTRSGNGAATSLDPSIVDPAANDDETAWCAATTPYGDGDLGTPGARNPSCGGPGPGAGECEDGSTSRPTVAPQPGDLVITEFMPDPTQVGDTAGEWFEVLATADVDLNGLEIGRTVGSPLLTLSGGGPCQRVRAGQRLVFAKNADPSANGGLPMVFATVPGGLSLVQSDGSLFLGYGGQLLDEVTWATATAGASTSVAPGFETPELNVAENSCPSTSTYGLGDRGTPGNENDPCG